MISYDVVAQCTSSMADNLLIKTHSEKARIPTRGSAQAAGYDLYRLDIGASISPRFCNSHIVYDSAENKVVPARGKATVDTQISIAVPPGTYGRVAPRSGLGEGFTQWREPIFFLPRCSQKTPASKFSIDTGAGVIDADYRGILFVLLFNLGDQDFEGQSSDLQPATSAR